VHSQLWGGVSITTTKRGTNTMRRTESVFGRLSIARTRRHCTGRRPGQAAEGSALSFPADMKAILLAGGKGTRLRPLTLNTPKPIVPIFNRPFLMYQIDLLKQVPEIDEVILSLNYQQIGRE